MDAHSDWFERKMQLRLMMDAFDAHARGRAEATVHAQVEARANADVRLMKMRATVPANRRQAELRHLSSIGSCSTLLTRIGPAIAMDRAGDQVVGAFFAPDRVGVQVTTSGEDICVKWHVWERAFVRWRKREWLQHVSFRAEADAAVPRCAGSRGDKWQGHLSFIRPSLPAKMYLDEVRRIHRTNWDKAGELDDLQAAAFYRTASTTFSLAGFPSLLVKLHPDCESYGRVPPNMPHPPLPPNPPTGRPNAPARTHLPS